MLFRTGQDQTLKDYQGFMDRKANIGGTGVNYEAFRARYPFDDDAHSYL